MFRTVFPSIIRSSKLHIRQQACIKELLLPAASGDEMELQFDNNQSVPAVVQTQPLMYILRKPIIL